jgi:hypothetical protein
MELLRRSLPPRAVAAAMRALRDEQRAMMRAMTERRQTARITARARQTFDHAADKAAAQQTRGPPQPR